jgi:hypothetical protein
VFLKIFWGLGGPPPPQKHPDFFPGVREKE